MKKILLLSLLVLGTSGIANAQYRIFDSGQVGSTPVNGYYLKTDGKNSSWEAVSGGGGGADGNWVFFNGSGIRLATTTNQVVIGASATTTVVPVEVTKTSAGALIDLFMLKNVSLTEGTETGIFFSPTNTTDKSRGARISAWNNGGNAIDLKFYPGLGATIEERMRLSSVGNLGLGTTSPFSKVSITNTSATQPALSVYGATNQTSPLFLVSTTTGTATTTVFAIDSNGNTSIGTSTADYLLQLNSRTLQPAKFIEFSNPNNTATRYNYSMNNDGVRSYLQLKDSLSGFSGITLNNAGNVGIGTTSPSSKLTITGTTPAISNHQALTIYSSDLTAAADIGGTIGFGGNYSTGGALASWAAIAGLKENSTDGNYAGYLSFRTRAAAGAVAETMRITSSGNVGIGTTSPEGILSISNSARTAANTPLFTIASTTAGNSTTTLLTLTANGRLGLGSSTPFTKLDINTGLSTAAGASLVMMNISDSSNIPRHTFFGGGYQIWKMNSGGGENGSISNSVTTSLPVIIFANSGGTGRSQIRLLSSTGGLSFGATALGTEPTGAFFIDNTGQVAVGTSSPRQKFEVSGSAGAPATSGTVQNGIMRLNRAGGGANGLDFGIISTSPYATWIQSSNINDLSGTFPLAINPVGGNVGIGTSTPNTGVGGHILQVNNFTATSTISATVVNGSARSTVKGGRIILQDVAGGTCTEITTQSGVITGAVVACP